MDNADLLKHLDADPDASPILPGTLPLNSPCWNGPSGNNEISPTPPKIQEERFGLTQQLFRGQTQPNYINIDPTIQPFSKTVCKYCLNPGKFEKTGDPSICYCLSLQLQEKARKELGCIGSAPLFNHFPPPIYPYNSFPYQENGLIYPPLPGNFPPNASFISGPQQNGCVLIVHKLDPMKANPDKLFNLFCLYGNVFGVVFVQQRPGCAMVQMGDMKSVFASIHHLKNMPLWGNLINVGHSRKPYLTMPNESFSLPDKSPSHKDFSITENNRFYNLKKAVRNRIVAPSKIIFFYNAPSNITEEQLIEILKKHEVDHLPEIHIFPPREAHTSGLFQFERLEDATNCLVNCNHLKLVDKTGSAPYVLKLSFTSSRPFEGKSSINSNDK